MSETKFVHELRKSVEHYARANGVGPAPTWKLHGTAALSSMPDILGVYWHTTFFMECKVREKPKKSFNLMAGLTPAQKATLRAITVAGGFPFLAVRLGKSQAIIFDFHQYWRQFKKFPSNFPISLIDGEICESMDKGPFAKIVYIVKRQPGGLWEGLGRAIHDE